MIFFASNLFQDMFGSAEFVHGWLIPYMERFQGTKFRGAIILDSILNYDPLPSVQKAPDDFEEVQRFFFSKFKIFTR